MKNYKILGFIIGCHSCAACYIVNGEIIANIEEERLVRIKTHIDFENDFERYPVQSIENLIQRHGMELGQIDYFTSFLPLKTAIEIFRATYNFDIPEHKYIQIDHHEAHSILSYYMSGFQDDTLVFCCDASGGENRYSSKTYVGTKGKLHFIDGINLKHRSFGHFYACLTELIGFKRLKDEGKVVGLSGHGTIWNDLYFAWQDVLQVIGTKTNEDNHIHECGEIYLDMYKKYFSLIGSKYWKTKSAIEDIAYAGNYYLSNGLLNLYKIFMQRHRILKK